MENYEFKEIKITDSIVLMNAINKLRDRVDLIESMLKEFYNICNHLFNEVHKND